MSETLVGTTIGDRTVIAMAPNDARGKARVVCRCKCGRVSTVDSYDFRSGHSTRCPSCRARKHGGVIAAMKSPTYRCWQHMCDRCLRVGSTGYEQYGGRGILVCARWTGQDGFATFLSDMGERPTLRHSLDRFPNRDGNYEPGNVRWATPAEQNRNTSRTRLLTMNGETLCLSDWASRFAVANSTLRGRLRAGMSLGEAVGMGK